LTAEKPGDNLDIDRLFEDARTGNTEAEKLLFSKLLVRFRLIAYHILRDKESAEDAAHDALVNVLRTYRDLEVHTSFAGWAQSIIRRQALKCIEKRKREQNMSRKIEQEMKSSQQFDCSQTLEAEILKCLKKLSIKDRRYARVLNLKHMGFTFEEICDRLGMNPNNAYVLLHRARKAMAYCLEKGEGK
jgi:RNA polymerase sigma-70 factor (ECF subfamily)